MEQRIQITDNQGLLAYLGLLERLADAERKEAWKQLRSLYQDRKYSAKNLKTDNLAPIKDLLDQLEQQITNPPAVTQIPHVFLEPLLRINPERTAYETLRQLIKGMNDNFI